MKTMLLAATWVAIAGPVLADIAAGRGDISASATATATYDSNVYGTPDAIADWSGVLIPRLSYVRKAGRIEADLNAGVSIIRYREQTQLDAENLDGSATLKIPESDSRNYSGLLSALYRESSDLNTDLNVRINSKTTTLVEQSALVTGPRTNVALSGTYTDTQRTGYGDQQIFTSEGLYDYKDFFYGNSLRVIGDYDELHTSGDNALGVPLNQNSYLLSAGLGRALYHDTLRGGISFGYRVLNRSAAETAPGQQQQRSGYVIGASLAGPFLPERYFPKITSQLSVDYQDAATPGIYDTGTKVLTGRLSLAWQARPNTSISVVSDRLQRLSANDLTVVTTDVRLALDQTLRPNLTGTLGAGYEWSSYGSIDRHDRTFKCSAALRYLFARVWHAEFTSTLNNTTSTVPASTYDRIVTSLSLSRDF